jgi:hypothetical protein
VGRPGTPGAPPCMVPRKAAASLVGKHCLHATLQGPILTQTVYLMFQLDLDVQLQRCLNTEAYSKAQEIRAKRVKVKAPSSSDGPRSRMHAMLVSLTSPFQKHAPTCTQLDEAIQEMAERKAHKMGGPTSLATLSFSDFASEGIRLRTEMTRAVEDER